MMLRTNVSWRRGIHALILAGAILLAIGGGSALAAPSCAPSGVDTVCTFSTPGADTFTVPAGVTEASFDLFGAQGGSVDGFFAGLGGRASAELALTPGATLTVVVGGAGGSTPGCSVQPGRAGGVNGGAPGGSGACEGPGGGGASDVRIGGTGLSDRVLVAGGGGGGANVFTDPAPVGGGGGGLTGQGGSEAGGPAGSGGSGGDQTGASGSGLLGVGSPGADGSPVCCIVPVSGGGGGGGYYGGAGGQPNQGGGGGSGFGPPGVVFETGVRAGDGLVTITYQTPLTFGGFRQPVDNPPTVNTGRAGRTYPVKFQVRDQNGAVVTSLAAVSSITHKKVACGAFTGDPTDSLETEATGGTSLRFDGDQFIYNWKTPTVAGCYELFVTLADGSVHSANFSLR
jgi:Glycine rich protein